MEKFKIMYAVHGMQFEAIAYGASDAFDYVKAIIKAEKLMYPNQDQAFENYLCIIAEMTSGKIQKFSSGCGLFSIQIERKA